MYKCVIFDVDGTLIDTKEACYKSFYDFIINEKLTMPNDEVINSFFGLRTKTCFNMLGLDGDCALESSKWEQIYQSYSYLSKLYDNAFDVIKILKGKNIQLGIVTSRNYEELYNDDSFKLISKYFDHIVVCNDTILHKPHPDPLLKFLEKSGNNSKDCIFIGDTIYDFLSAKAAKIDFALACWGTTLKDELSIKKLFKFEDILSFI